MTLFKVDQLLEIEARYEAAGGPNSPDARNTALNEIKGLQSFLKFAISAGSGPDGRPLLILNSNDPHLPPGTSVEGYNNVALQKYDLDAIRSGYDLDGNPLYRVDPDGNPVNYFEEGVAGRKVPGDVFDLYEDGPGRPKATPFANWDDDTRADRIVRSAVMAEAGNDVQKARQILESSAARDMRTEVLNRLKDTAIFADGSRKPTDLQEWHATVSDHIRTTQGDAAAIEFHRKIAGDMSTIAPETHGNVVQRFFVNESGAVDIGKHGMTYAAIVMSAIFVDLNYKAETVDNQISFGDWAAQKVPQVVANVPAMAFAAGSMILLGTKAGVPGKVLVGAIAVAGIYDGFKQFVDFYIESTKFQPEDEYRQILVEVKKKIEILEKNTWIDEIFNGINTAVATVVETATAPLTPTVLTADSNNYLAVDNKLGDVWLVGLDAATIVGNDGNNVLIHYRYGQAQGGDGNDFLMGFLPDTLAEGERIGPAPNPDFIGPDTRPVAERDLYLVLDGQEGDDILTTVLGEHAWTIGGEGRDFIFNTSKYGVVFGDTIDGLVQGQGEKLAWSEFDQLEKPENSDNIWWWGSTTMWDPRRGDVLKFFGYPLVGGTNDIGYFFGRGVPGLQSATTLASLFNPIFLDYYFPFFNYVFDGKGTLYVANLFTVFFGQETGFDELGDGTPITGAMAFRNYDDAASTFWGAAFLDVALDSYQSGKSDLLGDLNMVFKKANPALALFALLPGYPGGINQALPMIDDMFTRAAALTLMAKAARWSIGADPLILDLDGDGIETINIDQADVWFDLDNDLFAEKTGWLGGDDGFLVRDLDGDGRIESVAEMFGGPGQSGLAILAQFDANGDGRIDATDLIYSELQVWQDRNENGVTDAGELTSLADLGIVSINVTGTDLRVTTPQGTFLDKAAEFTWANGDIGRAFDAIFEMNDVDSKFAGYAGIASWLGDEPISARGFGQVADLAIAMSNDFDLARLVAEAAADMTVPSLRDLRHKSGEALGQWGFTLDQTRELTAVQLSADGSTLLDRAIWVEDATGGYWNRASGQPILTADGVTIPRPSLEQVLAQDGWQAEQVFSPSTRATALTQREAVPYLAQVVDGRAVIVDYGVQNLDGSWRLASGTAVLDADGVAISAPTKADILAQAHTAAQEWRVEEIGFNPLAALTVDQIGVYQVDGKVVDYTVLVTDNLGDFHVWARVLDQALELQAKNGTSFGYDLRAYALDFNTLDIVDSDDDSVYRVEVLTPGQFNFATELSGVTFNPAMLTATLNRSTGVIGYSVNDSGNASLSETSYVSGVKAMIQLLDPVVDQYLVASRAFALRMAFQGGLADYFDGIGYNAATDKFAATTDLSLVPLYSAIFADAPSGALETTEYLQGWHQILTVMYPDYQMPGKGNLLGQSIALDQRFIFQNMLAAYQTVGLDIDLQTTMYALGLNQDRLIETPAGQDTINGTNSIDYFVVGDGAEVYRGGLGGDVYVVGTTFGDVITEDLDYGALDELRFSNISSKDINVRRVGQDLLLSTAGNAGEITIKGHFLGEMNPSFGNTTEDRSMKAIIFSDGVIWDQFRIAFEVSDPQDTNDVIVGSGALDVLNGGKGNDVLQGGTGGDLYVFARGDGQDVVFDNNSRATAPGKGGLDFLQFTGDITADDLYLSRNGESVDLLIQLMNKDGTFSGDTITVMDQFGGMRFNLGAFLGGIDQSLALDYIAPNLIEKFLFEDGSYLEFGQITQRILENLRTDGSDVIYGFLDADTLDGGAGDDLLIGREGGDTYLFGRGDGLDVVQDGDHSIKLFGSPADRLAFGDSLTWGDLNFLRDGGSDTLRMRIAGTTDEVILVDQEESEPFIGFVNLIEEIQFGNGVVWTYGQLFQHYINLSQTSGNDSVYGFHTADVIQGGLGEDRLEGRGGSDRGLDSRPHNGGGRRGGRLPLSHPCCADRRCTQSRYQLC